jgi:OmpA-OmpF porin, OOP family
VTRIPYAAAVAAASCVISCSPWTTGALGASRLDGLSSAIESVEQSGALSCAPRELALARANYDFARMELAQGDAVRAEEHVSEAEENVGAAQVLTPQGSCAPSPPSAATGSTSAKPNIADRDHDTIPDDVDKCPDQAEDFRGPLDADGCSALDSDSDGIIDVDDACPQIAEDRDGVADDDGCPESDEPAVTSKSANNDCNANAGGDCTQKQYGDVSIGDRELRSAVSIGFSGDTANLKAQAHSTLDNVVQILREHPRMTLEIAAHTDSRGDDDHNLQLSQQQAESVRKYLVDRGVEATRLTARGYGETRPIESNSTSRGRAINRRIELIRTDRAP